MDNIDGDNADAAALQNSSNNNRKATALLSLRRTVQIFIKYTTPVLVSALLLFFSTVIFLCDSVYFYRSPDNPTNGFCFPIYNNLFVDGSHHKGYRIWPASTILILILLVVPCLMLLVGGSTAVATATAGKQQQRSVSKTSTTASTSSSWFNKIPALPQLFQRIRGGDPSIRFWAMVLLVLPMIIVLYVQVRQPPNKDAVAAGSTMTIWIRKLANPTGYCATISLALFLVPVSKQSPLLAAIGGGWSPIQALGLHIWAGRLCLIMSIVHSLLYMTDYGLNFYKTNQETFLQNIYVGMMPNPQTCWKVESVWAFEKRPHCYREWRNFTGFVSLTALILLTATSWNWVRRWNYRFFYVSHLLFGGTMLLFAIFHFYWIAVFLLPGILYYLACSMPFVVQQAAQWGLDGGTSLRSARILAKSNGCMELVFAGQQTQQEKVAAPAYIRICVPEISMMWHPFTIPHALSIDAAAGVVANNNNNGGDGNHDEGRNPELKLLLRRYGYFTTKLYKRLSNGDPTKPPTILVDGYYHGPDWLNSALRHDTILLVSGGIGVTPMLTLLQLLFDATKQNNGDSPNGTTNLVCFHWYCRDEGLIRHVLQHYLSFLFVDNNDEATSSCRFEINIHFTAGEADDTKPFLIQPETLDETTAASSVATANKNETDWLDDDESFQDEPAVTPSTTTPIEDPPKDIVLSYGNNSKGVSMEPAYFSATSPASRSRFATILPGVLGFIASYAMFLQWHLTKVRELTNRIFFRGYSLYACIVVLFGTSVMMEVIRRCLARRQAASKHYMMVMSAPLSDIMNNNDDDEIDDDKDDVEAHTSNTTAREFPQLPFERRLSTDATKSFIHVDVTNGRPFVNDVIRPIVEATLPGAFYCGPSKLLHAIQNEIKTERGGRCRGSVVAPCSVYQEHFEM